MARNLTAPTFRLLPLNFRKYPCSFSKFIPSPSAYSPVAGSLAALLERRRSHVAAQQKAEMATVGGEVGTEGVNWGKVSAVLFDMDGVLCNSEELSRLAAVDVFADLGVAVATEDFVPFMGTGNDLSLALEIVVQLIGTDLARIILWWINQFKFTKLGSGIKIYHIVLEVGREMLANCIICV